MATEQGDPPEDLDKTDRLPILDSSLFDADVGDDSTRHDRTSILPPGAFVSDPSAAPEPIRLTGVDLPSLTESLRTVEERIGRQRAAFDALSRSYDISRHAESASAARAEALAADLAATHSALELEQGRSSDVAKILAETVASADAARSKFEAAQRESQEHRNELRTLRDLLAVRDARIVEARQSLAERDAQLAALQTEHSQLVPVLEATSRSGTRLETDLQIARTQVSSLTSELKAGQIMIASLNSQLKRGEAEANATQTELVSLKTQASVYLERLQTRAWRSEFDQNLFREWDSTIGNAYAGHSTLEAERDRLKSRAAALEAVLASQSEATAKLQTTAAANVATLALQSKELKRTDVIRAKLVAQLATADAEVMRLNSELAAREPALTDAQAAGGGTQRQSEMLAAADLQIMELQSAAVALEQKNAMFADQLEDSKRPNHTLEAELRQLREELAIKSTAYEESAAEGHKLKSSLEKARAALEEREFLIRRLERSESTNANVLGRLQSSIERLGSTPATARTAALSAEFSAELIRVDGGRAVSYPLARRTRIGRAQGCELQIDASSVSRHHALLLVGPRDSIIEDLNSTNGVIVNGRKVSRQLLNDGDAVTLGEIQFRYSTKS